MITRRQRRVLDVACVLAIVGLALMMWSQVDPRVVPVILAMSAGQGIGTLSLAAFLWVVVSDVRSTRREAREKRASESPPAA